MEVADIRMEGAATILGLGWSNKGYTSPTLSPRLRPRPCWGGRGRGSLNIRQYILVSFQWNLLDTHHLECGESYSRGSVPWKHFAAQPPEQRGARRGWWLHDAAGCPDCRSLVLGKPSRFRGQLNKNMASSRQNSVLQGFPHTLHS